MGRGNGWGGGVMVGEIRGKNFGGEEFGRRRELRMGGRGVEGWGREGRGLGIGIKEGRR